MGAVADCFECPPGKYCLGAKALPDGDCDAGNFCPKGQSAKAYAAAYKFGDTVGGKCPAGHYCLAGSLSPVPCPIGTYTDTEGLTLLASCSACVGGYYCDEEGLTLAEIKARDKVCDPGYYCTASATKPHPTDGVTGGLCTKGNYCPSNSSTETPCAKGMYETRGGSDACQECPAGYYCEKLGTDSPVKCQTGYCPERSIIPTLCPSGRYSN